MSEMVATEKQELALLRLQLKAALHVTTISTINHLLRYDEYLQVKTHLPYGEWLKLPSPHAGIPA